MNRALAVLAAWSAACMSMAHGFDERYDLPAPLGYFVAGAAIAVALSFVVAVLFARRGPAPTANEVETPARTAPEPTGKAACTEGVPVSPGTLPPALRLVAQLASVSLFVLAVVAALWGTADPMMNLAPTLVWIIWWVGLSLVVACIGNIWPIVDPWRALFEWMDAAARRLGSPAGIALEWNWPSAVGAWPAVALLLLWSWLEVIYPAAAVPFRLGCVALAWSGLTLCGMVCFGREAWQRNADVFAIYFATLGRMAPLGVDSQGRNIVVRPPGAALVTFDTGSTAIPAGGVGFVIAMLATVLFDGLHAGQSWLLLDHALKGLVPELMDINGYFAGTIGLVGVWIVFFAAYAFTCVVTARLAGNASAVAIARRFAPTLVPIAVAYNIAHNFSSLLMQGQNAIPLLSDPLGRHWNLFGTADMHANIGIVDAKLTWYVAIGAIVAGHVIAVWLAHRVALREYRTPRQAAIASIPLTVLMVAYTAISLSVIAEPMVTFEPPPSASGPGEGSSGAER